MVSGGQKLLGFMGLYGVLGGFGLGCCRCKDEGLSLCATARGGVGGGGFEAGGVEAALESPKLTVW